MPTAIHPDLCSVLWPLSAPADGVILEQYGNDYLQETQPITALRAVCSSGTILAVSGFCLCACDVSGLCVGRGLMQLVQPPVR